MFKRCLICTLLALVCTVSPGWSAELAPIPVRNLSPTILVHQLATSEPARLNAPNQLSARLGFDIASTATKDSNDEESIVLDGETYVATLGLRYGLNEQLQVGVDLPWVWQSKGFLDNFIEDFHDFFGFPNGDRDELPNDEINYSYTGSDGDGFELDHEANSLGDIRLLAAWQFLDNAETAASLHATVKAPTGDADKFTGSGGWDVSLALSLQRDFALEKGSAALWGGFGGSWLDDGDILEDQVDNWAASAWLGAGWSPLDWLGLKCQLDTHTGLYDSDLDELNDAALILTVGGVLALSEATSLDLALGEGLVVDTSPDVSFHLGLSHRF